MLDHFISPEKKEEGVKGSLGERDGVQYYIKGGRGLEEENGIGVVT